MSNPKTNNAAWRNESEQTGGYIEREEAIIMTNPQIEIQALKAANKALLKALRKIADIDTASCGKYVAIADSIAIDALVAYDCEHYKQKVR